MYCIYSILLTLIYTCKISTHYNIILFCLYRLVMYIATCTVFTCILPMHDNGCYTDCDLTTHACLSH